MYNGMHPNAMQIQQTYDQLQNRAMEELNDEIKRLKDIIIDKDKEIDELKEITDQGTLQKKLANILEENNNLKLEIKQFNNNKQQITQIKQELNDKNDEIYRLNEKINILNDEYNNIINKNSELNKELIDKTNIINKNKLKDDKIIELNKKIIKYETLINDLKNATKINDLEKEINTLNNKINTMDNEKILLSENNKHLNNIYDEIKTKYTKLLNDFDKNIEQNNIKYNKKINTLTDNINVLNDKSNNEINKNKSLKKQISESQLKLNEMEQLNIKLIKGYNLEDVINDLQTEKNMKLNLQNELKAITKKLSKKEKTNLVLLNKNKMLTETLSLSKNININMDINDDDDDESTYFDHIDQIEIYKQNIQSLNTKIDELESDKYKLLMQIHEQQYENNNNHNDKIYFSGLNIKQKDKVKIFVKKLIKKSLMPTDIDIDDDDDDNDMVKQLKKENNTLKEWKDTLMTKLFETGNINIQNNNENENKNETMNTMDTMCKIKDANEDLIGMFGISCDDICNDGMNEDCDINNNISEMNDIIGKHSKYVNIVMNVIGNNDIINNIADINILINNNKDMLLQKENDKLNDIIEDLNGYKIRHNKIENIFCEKDESELIKKVDNVTKENMILIVNEKKLSNKYINIKKQQKYLFCEYRNLLKYLIEMEGFLFNKLLFVQNKNDAMDIFIKEILSKISSKMIPFEQYKNIEIECKTLNNTKEYLLNIINKYQNESIEYFKCKQDNIQLNNQLIEMQTAQKNHRKTEEIIYNATVENDINNTNIFYKSSIKMTENEMEIRGKKYENAMNEIKQMEKHSNMLHEQINELRGICLQQTKTICEFEKNVSKNKHCNVEQYNILENKYDKLKCEYNKKLNEIEIFKQKTEFAVQSLQALQSKVIGTFDIDINNETNENETNKIENILRQTQNVNNKFHMNEQMIKSLSDKVCSLEVEILKKEQNFNDLQMKYFNIEKAKRFLETNFNCIYSQTLHKLSSKYLTEIDNLRNNNVELYEYLHSEQLKTKNIYNDMINYKIIIESFKIKVENLNNLIKQYNINDEKNKYLKNWQNKCTNLEIKQIEFINKNESLQNEIQFLRTENKKYLLNIGSLQKQLSIINQELHNTKHEIMTKYELNDIKTQLMEKDIINQINKSVQTNNNFVINNGKQEEKDENNNKININKLELKIVSLEELICNLENGRIDTEKKIESATKGLQIMLGTAQDTIFSLQRLLGQKNESIEEYKNMISKLLNKIKEQQKKYTLHINGMKLKYNISTQKNEQMIISQLQNGNGNGNGNGNEWVQISQMKTNLKEKENIIRELMDKNNEFEIDKQSNLGKINVLNVGINEYHRVIQELNDKIMNLSDSLSSLKGKLNCKKKENLTLQKAVKTLKENMKKSNNINCDLNNMKKVKYNSDKNKTENDEMDNKMKKMEYEYKILRSSLKSEIDNKKEKMNEYIMKYKNVMKKNNELIEECENLKNNLNKKNKLLHKLQIRISEIQKDKITMVEKHSLSLKINKKKINNFEKIILKLENKNKILEGFDNKELNKYKKQLNNKINEINKYKIKIEKLNENINKLENKNKNLIEIKESKKEMDENENENENINKLYAESQNEIFELKKVIELKQMSEIKKLKCENKTLKRKYDLLNNESNFNSNKQITKLFEEIENGENKIIDLETKINELKFDREHLEINYNKLLKKDSENIIICNRNDPQLQNVIDSMKFIINKLKKENEILKNDNKQTNNIRINNLLKENRNLKKKLNDINENNKYKNNEILSMEMKQKKLEIERITNLNRRLKKENINLKEINDKYISTNKFKNSEINHLRKTIENERNNLKEQINEINIIWKRKMSLTNDDLLRYKKIKKDLEKELKHKNEINEKMSNEIKALIELIDHTKNINNQQTENDKLNINKLNEKIKNLEKENQELTSELSAFDVSFFNEIEDLKYRESQAQQLIIQLQSQLDDKNNINQ